MTDGWCPELRIRRHSVGCRLDLAGVTSGAGATLQEAGNDLLVRVFDLGRAAYAGRLRMGAELGAPDLQVLEFLWEIGAIAARGGNIRDRVFGVPHQPGPVAGGG